MINRRKILQFLGTSALAFPFLPQVSFASTTSATDKKFILIILRGAMDGLGAVPAYGDPGYAKQRGALAFSENEILKLDGLFGLNPALKNLHDMYRVGEVNILHAIASPYRSRSHFDGQDILESGADQSMSGQSGWLGRLLNQQGGPDDHKAIALAHGLPLILRGSDRSTNWAPSQLPGLSDDLIMRLRQMYQNDKILKNSLEQALMADEIAASAMKGDKPRRRRQSLQTSAGHAVKFLTADNSPNIAILEGYGWDTHTGQGTTKGPLANSLQDLDQALGILKQQLGRDWQNTAVAVVTEFGRTAWVNGNNGTDHGTGGVAFLLGGAVMGGNVITDWPGLQSKDLYQDRDLYPTRDLRTLFKGILQDHLLVNPAVIEAKIFPKSQDAKAMEGLFKT